MKRNGKADPCIQVNNTTTSVVGPLNLQVAINWRIELKSPKHIQKNPRLLTMATCIGKTGH